MKYWCILLGAMLCVAAPAVGWADDAVSVQAHVDRTAVSPGESVQLMVTVYNGSGDVDLTDLPDFKVYAQGSATSMQMVNGRMSRQVTHNYLLVPRREGKLAIPAITVAIDGNEYHTDPISITVSKAPVDQSDPSAREVWVDATVSNPSPFLGEQITYRLALYQLVRMTDATFEPPDFTGFTAKEIKERGSYRKIMNGREVVVTEIYYVLVPVAQGRQTISPSTLRLGIVRPERRRRPSNFDDFFNDPFFNRNRVEPRVLQSEAIPVTVQSLPPVPDAKDFSGLVGQFQMSAGVDTTQLKTGDSATLTVTIQGKGNIMDARAPAQPYPGSLKTYADTPDEKIDLTSDGYQGKKLFRTALVPVSPGDIPLPPVHLTYFDVARKQYRTLTADLPALQVTRAPEGQTAPVAVTTETPETRKQKVTFTGRDILPPKEGLSALTPHRPMPFALFLAWLLAPGGAVGVLVIVLRRGRQDHAPAAQMRRRAQQALKQAGSRQTAPSDYLTHLYQALTAAILARAGRMGQALTWSEAEQMLRESGATWEITTEATTLLQELESTKFSGAQLDDQRRGALIDRTRIMVRRLGG